jgi:hypothetical protein
MKSTTFENELSIIQKTYDAIQWFIPVLNRLPLDFKLSLGKRLADNFYSLLEELIKAKFQSDKAR